MSRLPPASPDEASFLEKLRAITRGVPPPGQLEIARVRARLGARAWKRAPRRPPRLLWVGALVFMGGAAFGLGLTLERAPSPPQPSSIEETAPAAPTDRAPSAPRRALQDEVEIEAPPEPEEVSEVAPELLDAPGTSRSGPVQSKPIPKAAWTAVSRALRAEDRQEAEQQLIRLVESSQGSERESAELALAQLRLSSGNVAGAHTLLERLARSATSPLVAARAKKLLDQAATPRR